MAEEKEYGLLIAAIVAIVSIVGLVILFSRGAPVAKVVSVEGGPAVWQGQPEYGRGQLAYRDCVSDSSCSTGLLCATGSGDYKCAPQGYSDSPKSSWQTSSGRGDLVG